MGFTSKVVVAEWLDVPLEPVTVNLKVPVCEHLLVDDTVSVEFAVHVPDPVRLDGLKL